MKKPDQQEHSHPLSIRSMLGVALKSKSTTMAWIWETSS